MESLPKEPHPQKVAAARNDNAASTHTSLNVELDRIISIPFDLDEVGVFVLAGFGDVVEEFLHIPGGGGAALP
ncbi:MAG: hypothetical protein IPN51_15800 [Chloracidobacterium sp.]|nr:hypothetical protein [Chloracidobacterium sp.]